MFGEQLVDVGPTLTPPPSKPVLWCCNQWDRDHYTWPVSQLSIWIWWGKNFPHKELLLLGSSNLDTAGEEPGERVGEKHTVKEALKEAGRLAQGPGVRASLRAKRSSLWREGVHFPYEGITWWHCLYSVPPETNPPNFPLLFPSSVSFSFPTHSILMISFLVASYTVFFQETHFTY